MYVRRWHRLAVVLLTDQAQHDGVEVRRGFGVHAKPRSEPAKQVEDLRFGFGNCKNERRTAAGYDAESKASVGIQCNAAPQLRHPFSIAFALVAMLLNGEPATRVRARRNHDPMNVSIASRTVWKNQHVLAKI